MSDLYIREENNFICLGNSLIEILFSRLNGGVRGIRNLVTGHDFISSPKVKNLEIGRIWMIKLKNKEGFYSTITNDMVDDFSYKIEKTEEGITLHFLWEDSKSNLNVHVFIFLAQKSLISYWRINIENRSLFHGLWSIDFPYLCGLGSISTGQSQDKLVVPVMSGQIITDPIKFLSSKKTIVLRYPGLLSMQFFGYYGEKGGLYLASYDSKCFLKEFIFEYGENCFNYRLRNFPENMGIVGVSYSIPYSAVVGVFNDDWTAAAEIYREWALNQPWCSKGPLKRRKDVPEWLKEIALCVWNRGTTKTAFIPLFSLKQYLDVPIAVMPWHWWHGNPYDTHFPQYFPPREGEFSFKEGIRALHEMGAYVTPYVNSTFYDTALENWKKEDERYSAKDEDLKPYIHVFCRYTKAPLAAMCPSTEKWKNEIIRISLDLINEYDVDGIYLDCFLASQLCFDPSHGHPVGGGNYHVDGYRNMAERIKKNVRKEKLSKIVLSGEHCHESCIDVLDAHLTYDDIFFHEFEIIPMFQFVYHGYTVTYGSYTSLNGVPPYDELWPENLRPKHIPLRQLSKDFSYQFAWDLARQFIWGHLITFANYYQDLEKEREDIKEDLIFVKKLAKTYYYGRKYLLYGQMVRAPKIQVPSIEILHVPYRSIYSRPEEIHLYRRRIPMVLSSAWKSDDGSLGLAFVNIAKEPVSLNYEIDLAAYKVPQAPEYRVNRIDCEGRRNLYVISSPRITRTDVIEGREVYIIEIEPHF